MLRLPTEDGGQIDWSPSNRAPIEPGPGGFASRTAYAAAHVVSDPTKDQAPGAGPPIDWEATLSFRRHLWSLGFGVAEAMDTAQRGSGVGWDTVKELVRRTATEAESLGGSAVYGAMTDQLEHDRRPTLTEIAHAYREQVSFIEDQGGTAILMCSRHLAAVASTPEDFTTVYDEVISASSRPVMIHWLGEAFDPALAGYWGSPDSHRAADTVLGLLRGHPGKVSALKLSLLDAEMEVVTRRRMPDGTMMLTGDDLNFVDLVLGDAEGHSDALLGVFDPIAPVAAAAFQALDRGDVAAYKSLLEPTIPMSRHLFSTPTFHYKTGVVFLAYLNGFQTHFRMVAGAESARSLPHLARLLVLADEARLLSRPELAEQRMGLILEPGGAPEP
ncbi:MAG TPA: dihydrodipicolinate synthase family protein [Acidimicrobiia bacterium]|nr:dihydrodipicolinate synthase family protein [Acidimicrobiia bacterium]